MTYLAGIIWRTSVALIALSGFGWLVAWFFSADPATITFLRASFLLFLIPAIYAGIVDYGWRRFIREFPECLSIALTQIRANKIRSLLTALGVIIGIVAVTLMGTAILGIDAGVERSLAGFGDDVLYVTKSPWRDVSDWWNLRNRRDIRPEYADAINQWIAEHPEGPLQLAVPVATSQSTVLRGEYRVNNIFTMGASADLARIVRSDMKEGRFFTDIEARGGSNAAVIGFDVADALFPSESPIGKTFRIRNQQYTVVGVAARQGSFLGVFSWDSMVILPLDSFTRLFPLRFASPEIRVQVDLTRMADAQDELRGLMRRVRGLSPERREDFEINSQQVIREQIEPVKSAIAGAGFFITGLALFVGAIGIMNITYVSVKERTKEIGTRKALGALRRTILLQFLIEAVSICVIGGTAGLAVSWLMSATASAIFPSFPLVFSVTLVFFGLAVSVLTGILSGFAPAWQASKLDPVIALRYE